MSESVGANSNKMLQWHVLSNGKIVLTIQESLKEESKGELSVLLLGWSLTLMTIITSYSPSPVLHKLKEQPCCSPFPSCVNCILLFISLGHWFSIFPML